MPPDTATRAAAGTPYTAGGHHETLAMLQAITRRMAAADDLEGVLASIVNAIVDTPHARLARIFVPMRDAECPVCREQAAATGLVEREPGRMAPPSDEVALHLVASAGELTDVRGTYHRVDIASSILTGEVFRTRRAILVDDWRRLPTLAGNPEIARRWEQWGIVGAAGLPLEFRGEVLGTIAFIASRVIPQDEFEVLQVFADQAAMALKSAYLFRERERYKERLQDENAYLRAAIREEHGFADIVGRSPALRAALRKVQQVAAVETTVLLTGETGTGKELLARAIHDGSPRRERPMVKVNCGAIPAGVVESELFGHEKGAFTGAIQRRIGRFELADGGTLFLDEVGELTPDVQVKLLRVLQEREFERVGGTKPMQVDVRVVAATNRDLAKEVAEGRFRADLYYRLNVFPVRVPPLRERVEDLPLLVAHFVAGFQRKLGKPLRGLTPDAMAQLARYGWPGNVRELQNVLERACVLARGPEVSLAEPLRAAAAAPAARSAGTAAITTLVEHERRHIERALAAAGGRVNGPRGAAALLDINPSTLRSRMQKLGISKTH